MKTSRRSGLVAVVVFVISHFLPAYGDGSGFACFGFCWNTFLGHDSEILSGGWFYYSGFAISNILFPVMVLALFVTKKGRKLRSVVSVVIFLQVMSWLVLHILQQPPQIDEIKIGYYLWLIAYGLLVAAHLWKEPGQSPGCSTMRNIIPIIFVAANVLVGCHSPSQVHTQTASPTVAPRLPFRPLLMTTFGTNTSSDGSWRIGVSEGSVDLSHSIGHSDGKGFTASGWGTISPQGWKAHAGWLVFVESESSVWVYDGDRKLLLQTETSSGNQSIGTTYSSGFPCAVPTEVLSRLSEPARRAIKIHE